MTDYKKVARALADAIEIDFAIINHVTKHLMSPGDREELIILTNELIKEKGFRQTVFNNIQMCKKGYVRIN